MSNYELQHQLDYLMTPPIFGFLKHLATQQKLSHKQNWYRMGIAGHQGSSQTPIFDAITYLAKGVATLAYSVTFLTAENSLFQKANEALSKHRRAKNTC